MLTGVGVCCVVVRIVGTGAAAAGLASPGIWCGRAQPASRTEIATIKLGRRGESDTRCGVWLSKVPAD